MVKKILWFTKKTPSLAEKAKAKALGACFRHPSYVEADNSLEPCDAVMGEVPKMYLDAFPVISDEQMAQLLSDNIEVEKICPTSGAAIIEIKEEEILNEQEHSEDDEEGSREEGATEEPVDCKEDEEGEIIESNSEEAAEREDTEKTERTERMYRELNSLATSRLRTMAKARNLPAGARISRVELIEALLESVD